MFVHFIKMCVSAIKQPVRFVKFFSVYYAIKLGLIEGQAYRVEV